MKDCPECLGTGELPGGPFFRPGPIFLSRAMGLWAGSGGLWSDALFDVCLGEAPPYPLPLLPVIGVDTSMGKGEDFVSIHARWGHTSFHHESTNTMDPVQLWGRLREV